MSFSLAESWGAITEWIQTYIGSPPYLILLSGIAAVWLCIVSRDVRRRILYPLLVLVPIIINPLLYHYVYRDIRYWRFFWLIPQAILIALAFNELCRRFRQSWVKVLCLLAMSGIIVLTGANLFLWRDWYQPAENPYKIRQKSIDVCDIILADHPHPLCLFDNTLYFDTRQYSADIRQPFSKNAVGSATEEDRAIWNEMYNQKVRDWDRIFDYAQRGGFTHVTVRPKSDERIKAIRKTAGKYGFEQFGKVDKHYIFRRITNEEPAASAEAGKQEQT